MCRYFWNWLIFCTNYELLWICFMAKDCGKLTVRCWVILIHMLNRYKKLVWIWICRYCWNWLIFGTNYELIWMSFMAKNYGKLTVRCWVIYVLDQYKKMVWIWMCRYFWNWLIFGTVYQLLWMFFMAKYYVKLTVRCWVILICIRKMAWIWMCRYFWNWLIFGTDYELIWMFFMAKDYGNSTVRCWVILICILVQYKKMAWIWMCRYLWNWLIFGTNYELIWMFFMAKSYGKLTIRCWVILIHILVYYKKNGMDLDV